MKIARFILFFLLCFNTSYASLIITNNSNKYDNFSIQYFYDENSTLNIVDIQKQKFTSTISNQFTQGYKYGAAWFKLEFNNKSKNHEFVLAFTESFWSSFDLYSYTNSSWKIQANGLNIPLNKRDIQDVSPAFNIQIPVNSSSTFYIRGTTISGQIGEFQLYTNKYFYNPSRVTLTQVYFIYAFVLLAFVLLNIYNFIITKESVYIYYITYVIAFILFIAMQSGFYISLGLTNWKEGLHVVGAIMVFFFFVFSINFLELTKNSPLVYKIFKYLSVGFILFALLIQLNIPYTSLLFNIFASFMLMTMLIIAIRIFFHGFNDAKYYLIALIFYIPTMSLMSLTFNNIIPNTDITRYAFIVGSFIEIFFFTLILTNKYITVNKEKIKVQNALLDEKAKNEKTLKSEIDKQTQYLLETNEHLMNKTKELQKIKKQLTIEATTDVLSGLYNRRYFFENAQSIFYTSLRYKQNLSILMMDIDHFKNVNDTHGHLFGDRVIRVFSSILKDLSRESDIVARYGGEEFIVLLPQTDIKQANNLAQRIRSIIEKEEFTTKKDEKLVITVSIGITQLKATSDVDIMHLIGRCDKALYKAKNEGRNRVEIL